MQTQSLFFNILTFDWPTAKVNFYFGLEEIGPCQRIHKSIFPNDIENIFPGVTTNGTEFIYTTFAGEREGFQPMEIDIPNENPDFIKRYYDRQINYYFRVVKEQMVKVGFIKENQVWLPIAPLPPTEGEYIASPFDFYEKYSLRVQICSVSKFPEILLSYDGKSKVLKKSLAELNETVSPDNFKRVLHNGHLYKFDTLADNEIGDFENVYPVINPKLFRALGFEYPPPSKKNKYPPFLERITAFRDTFLNTPEFREIIPLHEDGFLKVDSSTVARTDQEGNKLLFGNKKTNVSPYYGIKDGGPYGLSPHSKVHFFLIFHQDDLQAAQQVNGYLQKGLGFFKGLQRFVKIYFHTEPGFSIQFTNRDNPLPEIETILSNRIFSPGLKYFAIYITPFSREIADLDKKEVYYKVKESLLKRNISSQVIDPKKIQLQGESYANSLTNISIAILAKLKGIPWRLNTQVKNELIVGVGAFKHLALDVQFIGSAFSFSNNGSFNQFEYFMKHQVDILAGSIARQIKEYITINNAPERLIIHFYKTMSDDELQPIMEALNNLEQDIPVFIITINKTVSKDLVAFDESLPGLMPQSGTFINMGNHRYLLFNNVRYTEAVVKNTEGWPFPIKLKIDCTEKSQLSNPTIITDLIDQVYQFSRMYWKSVSHQNLPVTIKYPEMVAQIAPHFDGDEIPQYGKDNLWFL